MGLEPACVSGFRNELPSLFRGHEPAGRLSRNSFILSEFLVREGLALPRAGGGKALVQLHCHHHASLDSDCEGEVLDALGIEHRVVPSGCCGMAGAFFETEKYPFSLAAAERVLLPQLRAEPEDTLVLADGFSCRSTRHLADLLRSRLAGAD